MLPAYARLQYYYAQFHSILQYGILVWGTLIKQNERNQLAKLQKRMIRTMTDSTYRAHTDPLFKRLSILKLDDIIKLELLKFTFKLKQKSIPNPILDLFVFNNNNTRNSNLPLIEKHKLKKYNDSFLCKSLNGWHELTQDCKKY